MQYTVWQGERVPFIWNPYLVVSHQHQRYKYIKNETANLFSKKKGRWKVQCLNKLKHGHIFPPKHCSAQSKSDCLGIRSLERHRSETQLASLLRGTPALSPVPVPVLKQSVSYSTELRTEALARWVNTKVVLVNDNVKEPPITSNRLCR